MNNLSKMIFSSIAICAAVVMMLNISYAQEFKKMKVAPSQKASDTDTTVSGPSTNGPNEEFIDNQPAQAKKNYTKKYKTLPSKGHEIQCPFEQVQTEITTPLPEGWWNTPQIGNLVRTRVDTIGGDLTLMCGYEAYKCVVYIMMKSPAGTTACKVTGKGKFVCK